MIYVISDIHSYYDRYMKILEKINFSQKDTLYILGMCLTVARTGSRFCQIWHLVLM